MTTPADTLGAIPENFKHSDAGTNVEQFHGNADDIPEEYFGAGEPLSATGKRAVIEEYHGPLAGDSKDDDGIILDEFFEANPNLSPPPTFRPQYPDLNLNNVKPVVTRLITRSVPIAQNPATDRVITPSDPVQILPADPNRKHLRVSQAPLMLRAVPFTATAPGVQLFTYTVTSPMNLKSIHVTCNTDASVGTRILYVQIRIPATPIGGAAGSSDNTLQIQAPIGVPASNVLEQNFAPFGFAGGNNSPTAPLPETLYLPEGSQIRFNFGPIFAGDFLSNIYFTENTHPFRVASEKADCYGAMDLPGEYVYESDCHTGPVWVYAPNGIGQINCQAIAVTV